MRAPLSLLPTRVETSVIDSDSTREVSYRMLDWKCSAQTRPSINGERVCGRLGPGAQHQKGAESIKKRTSCHPEHQHRSLRSFPV